MMIKIPLNSVIIRFFKVYFSDIRRPHINFAAARISPHMESDADFYIRYQVMISYQDGMPLG